MPGVTQAGGGNATATRTPFNAVMATSIFMIPCLDSIKFQCATSSGSIFDLTQEYAL